MSRDLAGWWLSLSIYTRGGLAVFAFGVLTAGTTYLLTSPGLGDLVKMNALAVFAGGLVTGCTRFCSWVQDRIGERFGSYPYSNDLSE
jgi:hypothetical protein